MEFRLNLASRVYLDRRSVRRWLLFISLLLGLLLAVNLLYGFRNWQQLRQVEVQSADAAAKLAAQRGHKPAVYSPERFNQVMAQVTAANQLIVADQFRWTDLLGRMEELLPTGVAIRTLQPNFQERSLQVGGIARDVGTMSGLLDALLTSGDKHQAYLLNHTPVELDDGQVVVQFSLVIREAF